MSDVNPLTTEQQAAFLALLARGASPLVACREVSVSYQSYLLTLRSDEGFSAEVQDVHELLVRNVSAALYKAALEGKVSAQTFYLRHFDKPTLDDGDDDLDDMPIDDITHMLTVTLPKIDEPEEQKSRATTPPDSQVDTCGETLDT